MDLSYSHEEFHHDPIEYNEEPNKSNGDVDALAKSEWDYLSFAQQLQDLPHNNIDISPSISNHTVQTVHRLRPSFSSTEYETDNTEFLGNLVDKPVTDDYNFNQDIDASFRFLDNVMDGEQMMTTPLFMSDETHETPNFFQLQNELNYEYNNNSKFLTAAPAHPTDEFVTVPIYEWPNDESSSCPVNLLNNIRIKLSNLEPKTISDAVRKTIREEFLIQDVFLGDPNMQHSHSQVHASPQRSIRKRSDQDVEWTPLSVYKAYTNIKSPTNGKEAYNHLVPYSSCIGTLNYRPKDHAAWKRSPNRRR